MRPTCALTTTLLFLVLSWCTFAFALDPSLDISQYAHTAWRVRDGFVKGDITAITQTPDGYLWLGTDLGLYRFDGVRAVPWQSPAGERLPDDNIRDLLAARDGTLWISTLKGVASLREGRLAQYHEVAGQTAGRLLEDHQGIIWFSLSDPGKLCAIRSGKAECEGGDLLGNSASGVFEDRKGAVWVSSETGVWRWRPGPPRQFRFPGGVHWVDSFVELDDGTLLLGTNDGMKQIVDGEIQNYELPGVTGPIHVRNLLRSQEGSLWIGTGGGLLHLHQGRVDTFRTTDGLSGDIVWSNIFEDREGSIWVGTSGGLDRFRTYMIPTIGANEGIADSSLWAIQATPDGSVWVATVKGVERWRNGRGIVYSSQAAQGKGEAGSAAGPATWVKASGLSGQLNSFGRDSQGRLWAATFDGVFKFEDGRFAPIPGVPGGNINSIVEDTQDNVWISHVEQGLLEVTPDKAVRRTPWTQFGNRPFGARTMAADPTRGGLWLGFYEGGVVYFKDGQIRNSFSASDGLGGGRVNHLRIGSLGGVWAATESGLSRITDGRIETLNSKNGLPCDEAHWSIEDNDHAIWVYMPCGLIRIEPSEWHEWANNPKRIVQTTVFDASDGVRTRGVMGNLGPSVTKAPDGTIWFVATDGISVIDPHHLQFNTIPPPVHVEQITADRKTYDASSGWRLPPLVRDLEIDYTAFSLVAPEKDLFRYKLEGFDRDWQDVGNRRQAFYTNLPPRTYRFRVIACNNSGVWNETGDSFDFSIAPAYYQTSWFRILIAIAILAFIWALYRLRLSQMQRQFAFGAEARVNERTRIARELHDTLLQSLHGVMFQFQAARNMLPRSPDEAAKALDGAILETEQAIAGSRDAIHDLRTEPANSSDLGDLLNATGEELAEARRTDHHAPAFRLVVEGERRTLSADLQDEVFRIAHEILRNAFQHSRAKRIEAEIRYDDRELRLRVRDDGIGVDPTVLEQGGRPGHWGLRGIHERAKKMGAHLDFWSEAGAGTEVQLTVPAAVAYDRSSKDSRSSRDGSTSFSRGKRP